MDKIIYSEVSVEYETTNSRSNNKNAHKDTICYQSEIKCSVQIKTLCFKNIGNCVKIKKPELS